MNMDILMTLIFVIITVVITLLLFKTACKIIYDDPGVSFICAFFGIWTGIFALFLSIVLLDKVDLKANGYDVYTLRLYYVGGSERTTTYKTRSSSNPRIDTSYGKFNLTGGDEIVPGVVRFEVLSVENVKE